MLVVIVLAGCTQPAEAPLQGYVEGEYVRLAAPFAGVLESITVKRGDQVAAGAQVFRLERANEIAARRQAEAQLEAAQARAQNLRSGRRAPEVEAVAQQLREAEAARELSRAQLERQQSLARSGFVSAAAVDEARARWKRDDANVASLAAQVETARLPGRVAEVRAADAEVAAAREALAQSDWRLAQRVVATSVAGFVHDTYYSAGDFVPAGSPVVSLLPPGAVKLRFFVPEPALARLARGAEVGFTCDGCPALRAQVIFVSDRPEFTPPVLYSKENRRKLVFLVEAKPAPEDAVRLHPGQPVDVTLPPAR